MGGSEMSRVTPTQREGCELVCKTNDDARVDTTEQLPWWQWVERHVDARLAATGEATGEVIGEFHNEAMRELATLRRECECLRREFAALQESVGLERGLRDLRSEVDESERRDDPRLEDRSRALRRDADHERWQRGPAARAARV